MKLTDLNDTDRRVAKLWEEGMTGGEIASAIGSTRSAVLGRIRRLRLKGVVSYKMNAKIKLEEATPKKLKLAKSANTNRKNLRGPQPPKPLPKPKRLDGEPISFMELTPFSCRYVVNDGPASQFLFCGKPKAVQSYCIDHAKLCYIPPRQRGETANATR